MEKKKCPQCKNLILITSPTCLYCGRPNKFITKEYVNKKWNKDNNKNVFDYIFTNKYLVFIFLLILKTQSVPLLSGMILYSHQFMLISTLMELAILH